MTDVLQSALEAEKRKFHDQLAGEFVDKCRAQLARAEVTCALAAANEAGMDACEGR